MSRINRPFLHLSQLSRPFLRLSRGPSTGYTLDLRVGSLRAMRRAQAMIASGVALPSTMAGPLLLGLDARTARRRLRALLRAWGWPGRAVRGACAWPGLPRSAFVSWPRAWRRGAR